MAKKNFIAGVLDAFYRTDSDDLMVVGFVRGCVNAGTQALAINRGLDDESVYNISISGIQVNNEDVSKAENVIAVLRISGIDQSNIRIGTVIYQGDYSLMEIDGCYVSCLGDSYILNKKMELEDREEEKMSVGDCCEVLRLFNWHNSKIENNLSPADKAINSRTAENIKKLTAGKIIELKKIYVLFNKKTGEPHIYATVTKKGKGMMCSRPFILLITGQYLERFKKHYENDDLEFTMIPNDENGTAIKNFLMTTFYLNGIDQACVITNDMKIDAKMIVEEPDFSKVPKREKPVSNPDLVRWLLLMGQTGKPDTEQKQIEFNMYYQMMLKELKNVKLLVPGKTMEKEPIKSEENEITLEDGTTIGFPLSEGKNGRKAVNMFTDWKRLKIEYGAEWGGYIMKISDIIDTHDCIINNTYFNAAACYVSKEMYAQALKLR